MGKQYCELDLGPCNLCVMDDECYISRFSGGTLLKHPLDRETIEEVMRILQRYLDGTSKEKS